MICMVIKYLEKKSLLLFSYNFRENHWRVGYKTQFSLVLCNQIYHLIFNNNKWTILISFNLLNFASIYYCTLFVIKMNFLFSFLLVVYEKRLVVGYSTRWCPCVSLTLHLYKIKYFKYTNISSLIHFVRFSYVYLWINLKKKSL